MNRPGGRILSREEYIENLDWNYFGSPEDFCKGDSIVIREDLDIAKAIIEKIGGEFSKVISIEELFIHKYSLDYKFFKDLMEEYLFCDQWVLDILKMRHIFFQDSKIIDRLLIKVEYK